MTGFCHVCRAMVHVTLKRLKMTEMTYNERWEIVKRNRLYTKCQGTHMFLRIIAGTTPNVLKMAIPSLIIHHVPKPNE